MSKSIFGGGVFSTRHASKMRMIGSKIRQVTEIRIKPSKVVRRVKNGTVAYQDEPPYVPKSAGDVFHPGGNSLCFGIQLAQAMGCGPIYAVGFTLQNGGGYFFGRTNPVTRRATFYSQDRCLEWCRWHAKAFPGMVRTDATFPGPIRDIFPEANFDAIQAATQHRAPNGQGHEPVA